MSERKSASEYLTIIDFQNLDKYRNFAFEPQVLQIGDNVFRVANWREVLKIVFYLSYKEQHGKQVIDGIENQRLQGLNRVVVSKSRRMYSEPCKFSKDLYLFSKLKDSFFNLQVLSLIVNIWKKFCLYVVEKNNLDLSEKEANQTFNKLCKKGKNIKKNTKYFLAHINGECLSESEKLFIRIEKEYDKKILIGDISISQEEEILLNEYMRNEFMHLENDRSSSFSPEREKVFAFGIVRYAMKYYYRGIFWPHIFDEYGVKLSPNKQTEINDCFRLIMLKTGKTYDDTLKQKVDNISMHCFVTDKCATQFFDYLFDFWRLDLHRDIENIYGDFGKGNFKLLLDELKSNNVRSISDIMKHTSKAIELNEKSCRLRIRRILKMMDDCFWNKAVIPKTGNRINDLLQNWIANPNGAFNKELRISLRSKSSKGATLISKPQLSVKYQDKQFSIRLPREILPQCDGSDCPFWLIDFGNNNLQMVEPDLFEGKACYYTEEKSFVVPSGVVFKDIKMVLCSTDKKYATFLIKGSNYRIFKDDGKFVDYSNGTLPEGNLFCFSNSANIPQLLYGEETTSIKDGDMFVSHYYCENGNILSIDNKAVQVGDKLREGLIGNKSVKGVVAISNNKSYAVFSVAPKILFKAEKTKVGGIGVIVSHNGKDTMHRMVDVRYYEFKYESENDSCGYIVDLNDFLQQEGCYSVQISVPGSANRSVFDFCFIKGFDYKFNSAPYVFVDCGSIEFDKKLNIEIDNDNWEQTATINRLTMNFDPENDDHCKKIKDWKLSLNYLMDSGAVQLSFDLPIFRWKFKLDDDWSIKQPSDINRKDLPSHIYVNGPFAFTDKSNKIFVRTNAQISDDGESDVYGRYEETDVCYSYRISNLKSWLTHDIAKCEIEAQFDGKTYTLFNVICRSLILSHSLSGDFDQSLLCGSFEILGDSEYSVSIFKDNNIIEQDIPLVDGKFEIEMPLEEGDYIVEVYEIENDDSGFDSFSFKIGKFILKLVNLTELTDVKICIRSARDNEKKYQPLFFTEKYYIKNLERIDGVDDGMVDGKEIVGLWSMDVFDQESMDSCICYKGVCGYDMYSGKFKKEFNVLVIFYNKSDVNCIIVLRDDGDEYCELLYDKRKGWLLKDDLSYSGIERIKSITVLADDKYSLKTEIK